MDTAHWPQEIVVKPMDEIVVSKPSSSLERKVRPQKEQALNCPRCNSTNTKFCYYNNYSLTQPRYFCKGCRRYWTEGGSLRNIPFGGGSRKNKRSNNSSANSSRKLPNLGPPQPSSASHESTNSQNPKIIHEGGQDLNLAYPSHHHDFKTISELIQVPNFDTKNNMHEPSSALELLTGISSTNSRGLMSSFMPMPMPISDPNTIYSSGFSLQDQFKPTLNFSLDGLGINNGGYGSGGRLLFPFEDIKQVPSNTSDHIEQQNRDHQGDSTGYWNGVLGGGGGGSW